MTAPETAMRTCAIVQADAVRARGKQRPDGAEDRYAVGVLVDVAAPEGDDALSTVALGETVEIEGRLNGLDISLQRLDAEEVADFAGYAMLHGQRAYAAVRLL